MADQSEKRTPKPMTWEHVGWVDEDGRLWTLRYGKHNSVEGMRPVYAPAPGRATDG